MQMRDRDFILTQQEAEHGISLSEYTNTGAEWQQETLEASETVRGTRLDLESVRTLETFVLSKLDF